MQAGAPNIQVMWGGRFFSGMSIGMLSMVVPIYIAECSPEHMCGILGTLWQIAISVRIFLALCLNIPFTSGTRDGLFLMEEIFCFQSY